MNTLIEFLIHPVNTVSDLAGTIQSFFPDAAVLLTAINGVTLIPALIVIAYGHIPEAVPTAVRKRQGSISAPFSRIDSIGNLIRQPHPLFIYLHCQQNNILIFTCAPYDLFYTSRGMDLCIAFRTFKCHLIPSSGEHLSSLRTQ
jgi:hypothetical protein